MSTENTTARADGRANDQLRPIKITRNFLMWPEGSVLIEQGNTKVIVTASLEPGVPRFLKDSGKGWITAEYDMLPRATDRRNTRDRGKNVSGRSQEIQRLIGRAIRAAYDHEKLGEITINIDADVIQADGGTRCASITGAFVAVNDALKKAVNEKIIPQMPPFKIVCAISVGIISGIPMLDLCYTEDSKAEVDMNIIMDDAGNLVEVQGTAERKNFSRDDLNKLLNLGEKGIKDLIAQIKTMIA